MTFILVRLGGGLISTVLARFSGVLFSSATGIGFVGRRVTIVLLLRSYASRKIKFLVAHSPFLPPGRCPECGARNKVDASVCTSCGATIYPASI